MNFFFILSAKRVKQAAIILVASLFTAGIFYIEQGNIAPVFSTDNGPRVIYKGPTSGRAIALTFDITWGDAKALPIIELLKKESTRATFFLSASWAESHPDIVKRIAADGHEIGIMGYNYGNYMDLEDAQIKKDIYRAQDVFKKLEIKTVNLVRPPDGNYDKRVVKVLDSIGYTIVHWGIDSNDWKNPGVEKITNNVLNGIESGDIVLLHASDSAKQTGAALPKILLELKKSRYSFVTVGDLISNTKVKSKEIE